MMNNNVLFDCPFCQKDTGGNHAWNCPMNPINVNNNEYQLNYNQYSTQYTWSNNSISKEEEIKFRLKEINRQLERLLQEKSLLEKGIYIKPQIKC